MDQETLVYGVIRDVPSNDTRFLLNSRLVNCDAILGLTDLDSFPYLTTSMFSIPTEELEQGTYQTQVIHFAASYQAVEYHWEAWIAKFEQLLKKMFWVSATVHLETELSGNHTFQWDSPGAYHAPSDDLSVHCEWEHEVSFGRARP
ncbi:MAG: hypothetical protein ABJ000_11425 [Saccharospirillum sp.]|uniref:hypothetical protein n=1 Tax=Saccharospirillum sp. TaxID=2033801 RepID=UPI003299812B